MKTHITCMLAFALVSLAGCEQGKPGGPGTTLGPDQQATVGQTEDTFNLSVPLLSTAVQQGGEVEATVGINRAKNFTQDVTLQFAEVPQGVTITPASPVIKRSDLDTKIVFHAADTAPVGVFTLKLTGHPAEGGDALVDYKLSVTPIDSFSLDMPLLSTSLKQGESLSVSIGIKRDQNFTQDVSLSFADLPPGVTIEPDSAVIKAGASESPVTLKAAADAALGDFSVKVTGHPQQGADATGTLALSVVKE